MGGIPVVEVTRGGIPVTESGRGVPYEMAADGMGVPVRFVARGGAPFKCVGPTIIRREASGAATVFSVAIPPYLFFSRQADGTVTAT